MQRDLSEEKRIADSLPLRMWRSPTPRHPRHRSSARIGGAFLRQHAKIQRELDGAADLLLKAKEFSEST